MASLLDNFYYLHPDVEKFSNISFNEYSSYNQPKECFTNVQQFSNYNQYKENFTDVEHFSNIYDEDEGISAFYDTEPNNEDVFDFGIYEAAEAMANRTKQLADRASSLASTAGQELSDFLDAGGDKTSEAGKALVEAAKNNGKNSLENL